MLRWKRILLGVTGSIAAYKAADLTSKLVKQGAEVRVAMTKNAAQFVAPLTFQALSGKPVITGLFNDEPDSGMSHIELPRRVDAIVLAPCTANLIAKLAHGLADDWLSTAVLATNSPVIVCPAMNARMYTNRVVQENLKVLEGHGYFVAPTEEGDLACGEKGLGRLIEVERIIELIQYVLADKDLKGLKILVTAGPTREHLDPVRFFSNPSSGKMGFACAKAAARRGAEVVLVSGPSRLADPVGVKTIRVTSAKEMAQACLSYYPDCDAVIKAAGVMDLTPARTSGQKIRKADLSLTMEFSLTPDILEDLGRQKAGQILVGFAAETTDLIAHAKEKMARKNLDIIVANDVSQAGAGFESDTNIVKILHRSGTIQELPLLPKDEVAEIILDRVLEIVRSRRQERK